VAAGVALAGCGADSGGSPAAPATTAAADPKQALSTSTDALLEGNYAFTSNDASTKASGIVTLPGSALVKILDTGDEPTDVSFLAVGKERYIQMKADLGSDMPSDKQLNTLLKQGGEAGRTAKQLKSMKLLFDGNHWMHVDLAKLEDKESFDVFASNDVTGVTPMLDQVVTATRQGDVISGTLDVTAASVETLPWEAADIKQMGAAAKALPFTATVDGEGRLVKLVVEVPAIGKAKPYQHTTEFSDYGQAKAPTAPTGAKLVEMNADMYKVLNEG
jgi:hypothetical protein